VVDVCHFVMNWRQVGLKRYSLSEPIIAGLYTTNGLASLSARLGAAYMQN